jgi:hypothetical protein
MPARPCAVARKVLPTPTGPRSRRRVRPDALSLGLTTGAVEKRHHRGALVDVEELKDMEERVDPFDTAAVLCPPPATGARPRRD